METGPLLVGKRRTPGSSMSTCFEVHARPTTGRA
jgi:hypothetical protein